MSTTLTTEECAPGVAQQRECQTGPRASPEESRRSSAQFARWAHVGEGQLEARTSVDELNLGYLQVKGLLELLQDHRDVHNQRGAPGSRRPPRPTSPCCSCSPHELCLKPNTPTRIQHRAVQSWKCPPALMPPWKQCNRSEIVHELSNPN